MLTARGLSVRIGARELLGDVNAQFAPGEVVMVVGPNGAGKTTLLRCLNGELAPTHGYIELTRRPLQHWPRNELARARAVLPQRSTLDFPFSVTDVVLMGRMPHRSSDAHNRAVAAQVLELCDCAQLAERAYTNLSGGEQQRVQAARVLAQIWDNPATAAAAAPAPAKERYLLLDEPVSALDLSHRHTLLEVLKRLAAEEKIGIICALHDLNLVTQFADRVLVLKNGVLVADGAPAAVFTEAAIREVFDLAVSIRPHPDNPAVPLLIPRLRG